MLVPCLLAALSATLCSCQYAVDAGMRADVTFNNYNDRFDVGDIINEQKRQFKEFAAPMDYEDRRRHMPLVDVLKQDRRRHQRSQNHRRFEHSEEDFVQSYQPRMVDYNDEIGQYNKNLDNFRRLKPPEIVARRNIDSKVDIPLSDNLKTKFNQISKDFTQDIEETKSKNGRNYDNSVTETVNAEIKYNVLPKTSHGEAKLIRYIDTKGRRNNIKLATLEDKLNIYDKDPKGVILKYLHGGNELANSRRMAELKSDDDTLLNYAVPLRMTVKGYLELPTE